MIKLSKEQQEKVLEVTTEHDYDEKYMVVLNEGWENDDSEEGGVAFFDTAKEVKHFIDGAVNVGE